MELPVSFGFQTSDGEFGSSQEKDINTHKQVFDNNSTSFRDSYTYSTDCVKNTEWC